MSAGLTPKQAAGLEAIKRLTVDGVPPSYEELRLDLGLSSRGNVNRLLTQLRDRGHVEFEGRARTLRVLDLEQTVSFDRHELRAMPTRDLARLGDVVATILIERGARAA